MTLPLTATLPLIGTSRSFGRWGHWAVAVVLVLAFVTGGGSRDRGLGDVLTQLLALPLVMWAMLAIATSSANSSGLRRATIGVSLLILGTVLVQQFPLTESIWRSIEVRESLALDMQLAGVDDARHSWSLSPLASERGLWSLMPALAVFLGVLALPAQQQRRMLLLVVGLGTASLVLGFLQLGAPQDSLLNPFPEWAPALNGVFSNPNHQATALAISVVILVALLVSGWRREQAPEESSWARFVMVALAILLFAALPLTGSRAVLLLTVLTLVAIPVVLRRGRGHGSSASSAGRRSVQVALGLIALGAIFAAVGWLRHDAAQESRMAVAQVTAAMGGEHAPVGAGLGSFVPWFEQAAPAVMVMGEYYNHAHNEYAQWWLESGALGAASVLAVIVLLLACHPRRRAAAPGGDRGVAAAAWLGCVLLLLHSGVDYPLRTPALMTVAALLLGIVVAQRVAHPARGIDRKVSLTAHSRQRA